MPRLFISHSSHDQKTAALLIDLFRSALDLPAEAIRCTSVEGHRLEGGVETAPTLRIEIRDCEAFIGLVSGASIESAYVLFELGARWGAEKHLLPLLAPKADPSMLRGPLSGLNALSCNNAADLHQMVVELGKLLDVKVEPPAAYQRRIDEILLLSARKPEENTDSKQFPDDTTGSSTTTFPSESDEFSNAGDIIRKHCEGEWPNDFSMRAYCIDQQERALLALRRGRPADIPEEVFRQVRAMCATQWPDDFTLRQYSEEKQFEAFRKLHKG